MTMTVIERRPPNFDAIKAVFPRAGDKGTIFAYGEYLYNPDRVRLTPYLLAHEAAHGERQLAMGVEVWWGMYLRDKEFRFTEEVIGHRAEWAEVKRKCAMVHIQHQLLAAITKRLASPLYNGMCSPSEARDLITADLFDGPLPDMGVVGHVAAAG